jgi:beta-glucosidase
MGLFESAKPIDRALAAQVGSADHRALAREAVRESVVVLKNDGNVLPLLKTAAGIALAGNSADNTGNQCGGWTIDWQGNTGNVVPGATSLRAAFESVVGAEHVAYSLDGSNIAGASVGVAVIGEVPYSEGYGDANPNAPERPNGPNYKDLIIPEGQAAVVRALKQAGLPTVVVLIAGRPLILDPILPYADAIVTAWLPGSEGAGVTDVLFGDAHPTGKLPHSWPRSMAQIPINEGDASYDPLWPFGYGLTY